MKKPYYNSNQAQYRECMPYQVPSLSLHNYWQDSDLVCKIISLNLSLEKNSNTSGQPNTSKRLYFRQKGITESNLLPSN